VNRKAPLYDSGVLLTGKRLSGGDAAKSDLKGRNRQDKTAPHVKRSLLRREPIQQWTRRRLHEDDLVGHVLAQGHWEVLSFAAMAEAQRNRKWGTRIVITSSSMDFLRFYCPTPEATLPDAQGNIAQRSKMQSGAMMAFKSLFKRVAACGCSPSPRASRTTRHLAAARLRSSTHHHQSGRELAPVRRGWCVR